jgi:hypothetical protein
MKLTKVNDPIKKWATELKVFKGRNPNGLRNTQKSAHHPWP